MKDEETEEQNKEGETKDPGSISAAHDKKEEDHSDKKIVDSPAEDEESAAKGSDGTDCNTKMDFRTLSVFRGSCSLKNVTIISDLRANLSEELHKRKEDVWIVQEESGIIYNDDTTFVEFLKHQKHIEVMIGNDRRSVSEEYGSTDPVLDAITNKFGPSQKCRMSCNHLTEPENLLNYMKENIRAGNAVVKCPKCQASWEMEELIAKSDMSEDEQIFYKKAMSIIKQTVKKYNTYS
ncbi:uncharacterized protein LOC134275387 [Saccostrea cucullata]|uniref:uncharacterized protein LOC134275387 n=1 Tax=Saccostrea cuccullata TaxID=36930 RepID=UPI002ED3D52F